MNLTEWAHAQGIHVQTAYRWYREGKLPVPVRKVGRLILVSPETAAEAPRKADGAGLYARVSSHDQKPDLDGQVARLSAWAAKAGLPVVRVEAEVGSGMNGSRAKVRRLLADPAVTVVVVEHRDRLGRVNTELAEAALSAHGRRLVVLDDSEVTDDLVRDMAEVLTSFCARLYGRRSARNRALKALGCAQQNIGPRAVKLQTSGGAGVSALRTIAEPFVVAPPAGARVRTRLRVPDADAAVLRELGEHLGSLASADLAARCAEGRLDARGRAGSRRVRKQALTARSSSRWAGALTRTSEDAYRLAYRNLLAERHSLLARIKRIETRSAVPVGTRAGRVPGYPTRAERHSKTVRVQALRTRLTEVEQQLQTGRVSVCRGGKTLLHKRNNLGAAGLTGAQWREQWTASRLFLTADGEKDKTWGNETIRWNPDQNWLEIRLPTPLLHLANRPSGRYRLSCPVEFTYRGGDVAAQAATGAVRYDISLDPARGRWYLDASWKTPAIEPVTLDQARMGNVVSVDVNAGHLAVAVLDPDGNQIGVPRTIGLPLAGLPATTRDGHLRAAISHILDTAREHHATAVVIEDLDFGDARHQGRERIGNRPSKGRRGRAFRHQVTGIPTARFRDRLTHMACNAGMAVIAVDPAYTSRWGAQHWLAPMRQHHPRLTGHHAAAFVIGRRGLGLRARRRASGNPPAPEDAARSTQARHGTEPKTGTETRRPATRTDPRQPAGTKTGRPRRTTAGDQAAQDRSGPPAKQDSLLLGD